MSGSSFGKIFRITTWGESMDRDWRCDRRLPCRTDTFGRTNPRSSSTGEDPVKANTRQRETRADSVEILSEF